MYRQLAPPQLGQNILVVMERSEGFLDTLRVVTSCLSQITHRFFTLLCCCPARYWEHGGADSPELRYEIENEWKEEAEAHDLSEHCLQQARAILRDAGVPDSHILTKISTKADSLIAATMTQLRQGQYSGVIVSAYHDEIVNRLRGRGLTDLFRQLPKVEVWAVDTGKLIGTQNR